MSEEGYIDYFAVLELTDAANPGEVRKNYKKLMKNLVMDIAREQITQAKRDRYLLTMAQLNAAFYILRDNDRREAYVADRKRVIDLEQQWHAAVEKGEDAEQLRRKYDGALRHFLSTYLEEYMLQAGRDKDCVEASNWDLNHERHASKILREHRQRLYQVIHERLPYHDVTKPSIDWDERGRLVSDMLTAKGA